MSYKAIEQFKPSEEVPEEESPKERISMVELIRKHNMHSGEAIQTWTDLDDATRSKYLDMYSISHEDPIEGFTVDGTNGEIEYGFEEALVWIKTACEFPAQWTAATGSLVSQLVTKAWKRLEEAENVH